MGTDSKETHDEFIKYAKSIGLVDFVRGHNVDGRDTYSDPETEIAWVVWSDLRAENARLREELEKIAVWGDPLDYLQTIARTALEAKP